MIVQLSQNDSMSQHIYLEIIALIANYLLKVQRKKDVKYARNINFRRLRMPAKLLSDENNENQKMDFLNPSQVAPST